MKLRRREQVWGWMVSTPPGAVYVSASRARVCVWCGEHVPWELIRSWSSAKTPRDHERSRLAIQHMVPVSHLGACGKELGHQLVEALDLAGHHEGRRVQDVIRQVARPRTWGGARGGGRV